MYKNYNDKEFQNALMINKNSRTLSQTKDKLCDLDEECNAQELEIASKGSKALKTYSHLVVAIDLQIVKVLANSKQHDVFNELGALTAFVRNNASELSYLGRYWTDWFETLIYYLFFLYQYKHENNSSYLHMHVKFESWLKDNIHEDATAYTLAQAYNNWYNAKVAVNDYSGLGFEQYKQNQQFIERSDQSQNDFDHEGEIQR